MDSLKISGVLTALALGAALFMAAPPKAAADRRSNCQHRVDKAEQHYRHEAREHGRHSRQAEDAKSRLNAAWDRCWNETHSWYDPNRHEWRTDRDWDRNYDWDHDRDDRDRDHHDRDNH
jgi:hypothetical protein